MQKMYGEEFLDEAPNELPLGCDLLGSLLARKQPGLGRKAL